MKLCKVGVGLNIVQNHSSLLAPIHMKRLPNMSSNAFVNVTRMSGACAFIASYHDYEQKMLYWACVRNIREVILY